MKNKGVVIALIVLAIIIASYFVYKSDLFKKALSFSLASNKIEVQVGKKTKIDYAISNSNLDIEWKSKNDKVVKVDANGNVYGVGVGTTTITGTVNNNGETITSECSVSSFYGDKGTKLTDVIISDGELFITQGDYYDLQVEFVPNNAYVNSIIYDSSDENIVKYDGNIEGINVGIANLKIVFNKDQVKNLVVNVVDKNINPTISKKIEDVIVDNDINLSVNESKKINYSISPNDALVYNTKWESSNESIVYVDNSIIKGISPGNAKVTLTVNNVVKEINVLVNNPTSGIKLLSESNIKLKVGNSTSIKVSVEPSNATNKKVTYVASNSNLVNISPDGEVVALTSGTGTITVKTEDGNYQVSIPFTITPKTGVISGDGGMWGYMDSNVVTPKLADKEFFTNLARNGKGTMNNNTYTLTTSEGTYTYNTYNNTLKFNNRNILTMIFYPENKDLSTVNTFTFYGGMGEKNLGGYLDNIKKNPSKIKSSGIIILLSYVDKYYGIDGVYVTNFVKNIVNQQSTCKNTVGGFSLGGPAAADAFEMGNYDKLFILSSYFKDASSKIKLPNAEIIFFAPKKDGAYENTVKGLNDAKANNYTNITIISNNDDIIKQYSDTFLIVNPGNQMGSGHSFDLLVKANIFAYACK